MDASIIHHPHFLRRCTAVTVAALCTSVWLMIYVALWQAHVPQHWGHHLVLITGTIASFAMPCLIVWFISHWYDRARNFRGF